MEVRLKQLIISFLLLMIFSGAVLGQDCPIIPMPQKSKPTTETLLISVNTNVIASADALPVANYLRNEVLKISGISLAAGNSPKAKSIVLEINSKKASAIDAYTLKIGKDAIKIQSSTNEGLFRGVSSLLQLIRLSTAKNNALSLQGWDIEDAAVYSWRGLMLDESRHFFGKDKVKSILDWMAYYKLNRFHWHLTDQTGWRIEIKKYPRLTLVGGIGNHSDANAPATYYSQEDIKEIVRYAAERFITVIPEIDMPGHATAANMAYPQFSGGGSEKYPEFTFNPAKTSVYSYLSNILREVNVLFPSGMIHLGGDEVHFGNQQWNTNEDIKSLMKTQQLKDLKAVEDYFIRRMADSVFALNSKVLAWDEIASADLPREKTTVFWWRHDKPEELQKALDKGYKTVICPRLPLYLDFVQDSSHAVGRKWKGAFNSLENLYSYSLPAQAAKKQNLIEGIQGNLWTEYVSTEQNLDYLLFPRICALAEAAWTKAENKDYKHFENRIKQQLPFFRQAGLYYYNPFQPNETPEYNHKGRKAQPGL